VAEAASMSDDSPIWKRARLFPWDNKGSGACNRVGVAHGPAPRGGIPRLHPPDHAPPTSHSVLRSATIRRNHAGPSTQHSSAGEPSALSDAQQAPALRDLRHDGAEVRAGRYRTRTTSASAEPTALVTRST